MSSIIPFEFEGEAVRTVVVGGDPWFVGKDVAERLGYADPTNAMKQHCKGVVKRHPLQTAGGMQEIRILSEPDVLRLIIGSKLPAAERFERWVFEEVLPAIRRDGGYMVAAPEETPEELALRAMTVLQATVERQKKQIAELAPKASALDLISAATDSLTFTQASKLLNVKLADLTRWMNAHGWIYRQNGSWLAYKEQIDSKRLEYKEAKYTDQTTGMEVRKPYCHITPKGLTKLATAFERVLGDVT